MFAFYLLSLSASDASVSLACHDFPGHQEFYCKYGSSFPPECSAEDSSYGRCECGQYNESACKTCDYARIGGGGVGLDCFSDSRAYESDV